MNRREFFIRAVLSAAALAVDPEQLLWTPKKTIFIPPARKAAITVNGQTWYWFVTEGTDAIPCQTFVLNYEGRQFIEQFPVTDEIVLAG